MKLVDMKCKNCGAKLKVEEDQKKITCEYCDATFSVDDEKVHIKLDDMEEKGYEFEKGRIRAQKENAKKRPRLFIEKDEEEKEEKTKIDINEDTSFKVYPLAYVVLTIIILVIIIIIIKSSK